MTSYGTTIYLDTSGDIELDSLHRLRMTETPEEKVKQDIRVLFKTLLTEDIFEPAFGFDIISIKDHNYSVPLIKAIVENTLLKYKYFKSAESISVTPPDVNRQISIDIKLTTTDNMALAVGVAL